MEKVTIKKFFRLCGLLGSDFQMRSVGALQDPFVMAVMHTELNDLIQRVQRGNGWT